MRYATILMAIMLTACGPSCEGGHWEQQGFYYVWVSNAQTGTGHAEAKPNFICKKEDQ